MAASGNYKRLPDEADFIPATRKPTQTEDQMLSELMKLKRNPTDSVNEPI